MFVMYASFANKVISNASACRFLKFDFIYIKYENI